MPTLISSSKSLGGIYRAIVIERVEESIDTEEMVKNVRIYIPALHRTQMPFKLSADGSIEGCVFKTVSQSITNVSSPNSSAETDEENGEETEGDTNTTENETEEETSTTSETETEEDQDIVEDTTEHDSESLPPGLYMKKNDYPVAPISCWEVCPQLETGDQVWVIFENGDSEFPIVVGSLGAVLPSLSAFAATSSISTGMSLDANDESLSTNRGGSMTVQQFLDTYNKVNGNYTDQPTQDFGGVSGTECPELPRYYLWVCFGIPKEKTEGMGNGNQIAINVCNWEVTKNHFYAVDKSAGVMPGDIVSLTSNTKKGRLYGHTGVVKSVESNGNFQIIDQWANAPKMAITTIEKSRLIAIARPK